jgi:hypothetical protein
MRDVIASRHEQRTIQEIAVTVLKFRRRLADAEGKPLLQHAHTAFDPWFEHKEHGCLHRGFVSEMATDPNG